MRINDTFWLYTNGNWRRPTPFCGVRCILPRNDYCNAGARTLKEELTNEVQIFNEKFHGEELVVTLSGGIDSEITAETLYQAGIKFKAVSLRLFGGRNDYDLLYAYDYCRQRNIEHKIVNLDLKYFVNTVIPRAVQHGEFTDSLSQVALTELYHHYSPRSILIFSGQNPDYHSEFGWGWWEDSVGLIKYAKSTDHRFFTFTTQPGVFRSYVKATNLYLPGNKDPEKLVQGYNLKPRTKHTGWEVCADIHEEYYRLMPKPTWQNTNERVYIFITWPKLT